MKKSTEEAFKSLSEVTRALCLRVDSPRSLAVALMVKYREFDQLASLRIDPSTYSCPTKFALDYGVTTFLKKCGDIPMPKRINKRGAAVTAFARSEESCRQTNEVMAAWTSGGFCFPSDVSEVLHLAQRKIARLLRAPPNLDDGPYAWGPGATYDLKRSVAYPDTKLTCLPFTVTGSAWKHAAKLIDRDLHWKRAIAEANSGYEGAIFTIVPGGRYDTVPKTVLTDRSILVEPRLNVILQKRVGDQLRARLRRVGIDLNDQSLNQTLASNARSLNLATLDLEAASDTVSRGIVEFLLPPEWFSLLDDLRSKWYQGLDGSWNRLEKFSSMGNGFTFELESLIFWALAAAASECEFYSTVGVYGDDIIVRREVVPRLTKVLSATGFVTNVTKSFVDGDFFESCGAHFFKDCDVTPIYQKCLPRDELEASRMGNRLLRWAARLGHHCTLDKRVAGAWEQLVRDWRPHRGAFGPLTGDGDGYWEAPTSKLASCLPRTRLRGFGTQYRVTATVEKPREIPANDSAMLALWMMAPAVSPTVREMLGMSGRESGHELSIGMLPSRVEKRVIRQHRWVYPTDMSYLDW